MRKIQWWKYAKNALAVSIGAGLGAQRDPQKELEQALLAERFSSIAALMFRHRLTQESFARQILKPQWHEVGPAKNR